jgi:hypothetical protein
MGPLVTGVRRHQLCVVLALLLRICIGAGLQTQNHQPLAGGSLVGQLQSLLEVRKKLLGSGRIEREAIVRQRKGGVLLYRSPEHFT